MRFFPFSSRATGAPGFSPDTSPPWYAGNRTMKHDPDPSELSTVMVPPWSSTIPSVMASPRAVPLPERPEVYEGSKTWALASGLKYGPVSFTESWTCPCCVASGLSAERLTSMTPGSRPTDSAAFLTRFVMICRIC